ncbi:MAG: hypothetical protein U0795_16530 [Pirellulales bacterium]
MRHLLTCCLTVACLAVSTLHVYGADPGTKESAVKVRTSRTSRAAAKTPAKNVELFSAMEAGDIEVKFVPKDASQATVVIKNRTQQPLQIELPAAFAAVPVLAQQRGGNAAVPGGVGGLGGNQQNTQGGRPQGMGGGMGGMGMGGMGMGGMGMGGMGMGMGMMNVGPEKSTKFKVATVCLEHGKPDPTPRIAYEIRRIEDFTSKGEVIELCRMLGRGDIDQRSAQAAAWHLMDGLTWKQLASKERSRLINGTVELYFGRPHIQTAMMAVARATQVVRADQESQSQDQHVSPGEEAEAAEAQARLSATN